MLYDDAQEESIVGIMQFVRMEAAPGKVDALLDLLQPGREFPRTVNGCEAFDIFQSQDDPHQILLIERWISVEAHKAAFEKNVVATGLLDRLVILLTGPPQMGYYLPR